jgi:hypothetical protein
LPARSCFIDGEAIVVNSDGLSVFDLLRYRQHDGAAVLCAFDLIELDGEDLRNAPIEQRKGLLGNLVRVVHYGITLNEHYEGDGATIYRHPVALVARASYRNGSAHAIALAALTTGLRSRIRRRQPLNVSRRKIGETGGGRGADEGTPPIREAAMSLSGRVLNRPEDRRIVVFWLIDPR